MHAAALAVVEIWSFQERSDPRVTPSIEILSLNSSELESNDMSGRFLSTRLDMCMYMFIYIRKTFYRLEFQMQRASLVSYLGLDAISLLTLYKAQIRPCLEYGSHLWRGASKHSLATLDAEMSN